MEDEELRARLTSLPAPGLDAVTTERVRRLALEELRAARRRRRWPTALRRTLQALSVACLTSAVAIYLAWAANCLVALRRS